MAARWRLILGEGAEKADPAFSQAADGAEGQVLAQRADMDKALGFVYGPRAGTGDLSAPAVYLPRWLDLVRTTFPRSVVGLLLRDALENRGLAQLLLEPESLAGLKPDPKLIATLLAMKDLVPEEARTVVREMIQRLVVELERQIRPRLVGAVRQGLMGQPARHGSYRSLDWGRTLRCNLRHYDPATSRLLAERFYFRGGERTINDWHVILLVDQSGSMAESVIHASVTAAVLASVRSLKTSLILFGTEVADLSTVVKDPVEVLLGAQIGGGTDIAGAVAYALGLVQNPARTLMVLITDLYEGGDADALVTRLAALNESRCRTAVALAVTIEGRADYDESLATRLAAIGTPSFAATPGELVTLVAALWARTWPPESLTHGT